MNIENPMVVDSLWSQREKESKVVGECAGCQEDITADQDWYEVAGTTSNGDQIIVHQSDDCCRQYVADMSYCRGPID
jgi:hypothetical protein